MNGQTTSSASEQERQETETRRELLTYWICYWLAVGIIGAVFFLADIRAQPVMAGLMIVALRELSSGYVQMRLG